MGGPGSGRKPEGGGGDQYRRSGSSVQRTKEHNAKFTKSGYIKGGVDYNSPAFKAMAAKQKKKGQI